MTQLEIITLAASMNHKLHKFYLRAYTKTIVDLTSIKKHPREHLDIRYYKKADRHWTDGLFRKLIG